MGNQQYGGLRGEMTILNWLGAGRLSAHKLGHGRHSWTTGLY